MGLIVMAADKGAPGVTTTALALSAVWPRPVLLAECDPAGSDIALGGLPATTGTRPDPGQGLLSLAAAARRGLDSATVWEHTQRLRGGLDVLTGVVTPEQGAGLELLWDPLGQALAALPGADVIADCGRIGPEGPRYDLLGSASQVLLITRATLVDMVRLRERALVVARALAARGRPDAPVGVVVIADHRHFHAALADVGNVLAGGPAEVVGGIARDPRSAGLLGGQWGTRLGRSLLIRSARELAGWLCGGTPSGALTAATAGTG